MQIIDLATLKGAKAADRKALAIFAYDNASANPAGANWSAVADMLRLALPSTKAKAAADAGEASRFAAWADYPIPQNASGKRLGKSPVVVVVFADGETVRAPAVSLPGKPLNIGRALRVAFAFYRGRIAGRAGCNSDYSECVAVPSIVSAVCESSGSEFDAADANARTADNRAGSFDAAAVAAESATMQPAAGAEHYRAEYLAARAVLEFPASDTEYTDHDRMALAVWADDRPKVSTTICATTGDWSITADRSARIGWAVMTLWPDLTDDELVATAAETRPVAPLESNPPAAPSEIARASSPPAAPSFRVASRFLASTLLVRIGSPLLVAPSCILRVAA